MTIEMWHMCGKNFFGMRDLGKTTPNSIPQLSEEATTQA
jgi:hypothetical protein